MSDKTLYLSDLDGTLLQNDASLSPFAVRELNRMIEKGLCFSISSARSTGTVIGILDGLRLTVPIALFNGVIYYDYSAARFVQVMDIDPQAARQVARVMEQYDLHNTMYTYQDQQLFACYTSLDTERERQSLQPSAPVFLKKKWRQVDSLAKTAENERVVFFSPCQGQKKKWIACMPKWKKIPNITLSYYLDTYEPLWYLEFRLAAWTNDFRLRFSAKWLVQTTSLLSEIITMIWRWQMERISSARWKRHCRCIGPRRSNRATITEDGVIRYLLELESKRRLVTYSRKQQSRCFDSR